MRNSKTAGNNKRIALVVNTLSSGGAEHVVANLSRYLSSEYAVDIVLNEDKSISYPYEGNVISLGMLPEADRNSVGYQLSVLLRRTRFLRKLKSDNHYDAVISFSGMTNLSNVLSGNKYSAAIVSIRNSIAGKRFAEKKSSCIDRFLLRYYCRKADVIVGCSKEISDDLAENFGIDPIKLKTIYNGVDIPQIQTSNPDDFEDKEKAGNKKLIVTMGRMVRQKGQWYLLRVVDYLREKGLNVELVILGNGELKASMEDMCRELGISEAVQMPGWVTNPYDYLAKADVAVFPSLYEGFSNAILESAACRVPCIATDHMTGAREILAPGTDYRFKVKGRVDYSECGVLVPVFDGNFHDCNAPLSEEELLLAEAIERLLTDDKLNQFYREKGYSRAKELSLGNVSQQWADLIDEVRK